MKRPILPLVIFLIVGLFFLAMELKQKKVDRLSTVTFNVYADGNVKKVLITPHDFGHLLPQGDPKSGERRSAIVEIWIDEVPDGPRKLYNYKYVDERP